MALSDSELVEAVEDLHRLTGQANAAAYGISARRAAGFAPNLELLPVLRFLSEVETFKQRFFADYQDTP